MKKIILLFSVFCLVSLSANDDREAVYLQNVEKAFSCVIKDDQEALEKVKVLALEVFREEQAHPDEVQLVHAQDSHFYAYQVVAKALAKAKKEAVREPFEFLRVADSSLAKNRSEFFAMFPTLNLDRETVARLFHADLENVESALEQNELEQEHLTYLAYLTEEGEPDHDDEEDEEELSEEDMALFMINDTLPEIGKQLIAASFTLETFVPMDSCASVLASGTSMSLGYHLDGEEAYQEKLKSLLSELIASFPASAEKKAAFLEKVLEKAPKSRLGIVDQIFLPKDTLSETCYMAFGGGFYHPIFDEKFLEVLADFQENRQDENFRTFRNLQVRVIAGALFEDPRIQIKRYSFIPKREQEAFEALVEDAVQELSTSQR